MPNVTSGRGPTGADWESEPVQPSPWPGFAGSAGDSSSAQDPWGGSVGNAGRTPPAQAPADSTVWDLPVGRPDPAAGGGWGSAGQVGSSTAAVGGTSGPPIWMLVLAVVIPLATVPLLFVSGQLWINIVGWAVAIFGSLGFLTAFTVLDLRRRTSRWYVDQPGLLASLRIAALAVGLIAAGCQAYQIADFVARLDVWAA